MDENLPPHLAVMDRSTPKYRVHRGKQDDKMDKAIEAGMEGDREFATVKVPHIIPFVRPHLNFIMRFSKIFF